MFFIYYENHNSINWFWNMYRDVMIVFKHNLASVLNINIIKFLLEIASWIKLDSKHIYFYFCVHNNIRISINYVKHFYRFCDLPLPNLFISGKIFQDDTKRKYVGKLVVSVRPKAQWCRRISTGHHSVGLHSQESRMVTSRLYSCLPSGGVIWLDHQWKKKFN